MQHDFDDLTHWARTGDTLAGGYIERHFTFSNFKEAFAFMAEIAVAAEARARHPDWSNRYNRVSIKLTSHDVNGLTDRDLQMAQHIDSIARRYEL